MNKTKKIILILLVLMIGMCCCCCVGSVLAARYGGAYFMENVLVTDPQQVTLIGNSMLNYQLPAGYQEEAGFDIGIMKMVMMAHPNTDYIARPMMILLELPLYTNINTELVRTQIQQRMGYQNNAMELVEVETMTILGQQVDLLTFEGFDQSGFPMRTMMSSFIKSDNGYVMLMIMGPVEDWDQISTNEFIQSIE